MHFTIDREQLLKPLQQVAGVVERRQTLPVLSNVLLVLKDNWLVLTGTDLELELVAKIELESAFPAGEITVPAKKLLDICKSLPTDSQIEFRTDDQKLELRCGRGRFSLVTLPANEFPNLEETSSATQFSINQDYLKSVIDRTSFAMAQQDVRFYLNGMLFDVSTNSLRVVATDGHRLALCNSEVQLEVDGSIQAIVPRKAVMELSKLFTDPDEDVIVALSDNHLRVESPGLIFSTKLIDGKFPDFQRVLPKNSDKTLVADKDTIKQSFSRVAILSNEKYRGVRLRLTEDTLNTIANNPEQEEAEDIIAVDYKGGDLEIGFNVNYLLDVLNVIPNESVKIELADSNSSALIMDQQDQSALYVVMPMRL